MIFEQTHTDMVEVIDLPGTGVSLLTFAWVSRNTGNPFHHTPEVIYARTADVREIVAGNFTTVVTSLADTVTAYQAVRRTSPIEGDTMPGILTDVPWEIARDMKWREEGGLPSLFVPASELGRDVDPADLVAITPDTHEFTSFLTGKPVTRPMVLDGPSAEDFDLRVAAPILAAHPWVRSVHYRQSLSTSLGHTPPSLRVIVTLPQDVYDRVGDFHGFVTADHLDAALIRSARYPSSADRYPLGHDPLGLAPAVRTTGYPWPNDSDDDDLYCSGGEEFNDLFDQYPSLNNTFNVYW